MNKRAYLEGYMGKEAAGQDIFKERRRGKAGLTPRPGSNAKADRASLGRSNAKLISDTERAGAPASFSSDFRKALTKASRRTPRTPRPSPTPEVATAPKARTGALNGGNTGTGSLLNNRRQALEQALGTTQ